MPPLGNDPFLYPPFTCASMSEMLTLLRYLKVKAIFLFVLAALVFILYSRVSFGVSEINNYENSLINSIIFPLLINRCFLKNIQKVLGQKAIHFYGLFC